MTYQNHSLEQLKADCQQQIKMYGQQKNTDDESSSCLEIVHRATQNVADAFNVLWQITKPLVQQKCPLKLAEYEEDIVQEVSYRLLRKFSHPASPFRPSNFPAYRNYVNLIIRSVIHQIHED